MSMSMSAAEAGGMVHSKGWMLWVSFMYPIHTNTRTAMPVRIQLPRNVAFRVFLRTFGGPSCIPIRRRFGRPSGRAASSFPRRAPKKRIA